MVAVCTSKQSFSVAAEPLIQTVPGSYENKFSTNHPRFVHTQLITRNFRWRCVQGTHPFPSRTRWLRPVRPMVLCWRRYGRIGGCRIKKRNNRDPNGGIWKQRNRNWTLFIDRCFISDESSGRSQTKGLHGLELPSRVLMADEPARWFDTACTLKTTHRN